jgi:cysteinyl-tRNA synthetase
MFDELAQVLGLILTTDDQLLDEEIEELIQERKEARLRRDFARADEIRELLKEKGILLEDTPQGVRWRREK